MATLFSGLRDRLEKRAAYNRTVAELNKMPWEMAHDLDIDKTDIHRIASQAVYGK